MKKHIEFVPLVLLSAFTLKLLIVQNWNFPDAVVLLALAGVASLFQLKAKNDEVKEIRDLLEKHGAELQKLQKQDEYLQTSVTSMKIASQTKTQIPRF